MTHYKHKYYKALKNAFNPSSTALEFIKNMSALKQTDATDTRVHQPEKSTVVFTCS